MKNDFSQSMHSLLQSFISNACVICNVCCVHVHLPCCDASSDFGLTENICYKRCCNSKSCSIPVDLRKKCDSDHGKPVNMQAPFNQLTTRSTQRQLHLDSSNQENSANLISLNDLIYNVTVIGKSYHQTYKFCNERVLSYSPASLLLKPFDNKTNIFLIHFNCISFQKNVHRLRLFSIIFLINLT